MIDTPRSNYAQIHAKWYTIDSDPPGQLGVVDLDFSRELERELNKSTAENCRITKDNLQLQEQVHHLNQQLKKLKNNMNNKAKKND